MQNLKKNSNNCDFILCKLKNKNEESYHSYYFFSLQQKLAGVELSISKLWTPHGPLNFLSWVERKKSIEEKTVSKAASFLYTHHARYDVKKKSIEENSVPKAASSLYTHHAQCDERKRSSQCRWRQETISGVADQVTMRWLFVETSCRGLYS